MNVNFHSSYQLEFNGWSQLQISVDDGRIVQTEHHWIEDLLVYETELNKWHNIQSNTHKNSIMVIYLFKM